MKSRSRREAYKATIVAAVILLCSSARAFDTAFWVWQRSEPLSEAERAELSGQGARTIYWQTGELENVGGTWRWKARFAFPQASTGDLRFVPVVRLESREKSPFSKTSIESLRGALAAVTKGIDELQLDLGCIVAVLGTRKGNLG